MSAAQSLYVPSHRACQGGRFLRAFCKAPDLNPLERLVALVIGSYMPFDEGFVGKAAYPSVLTLSEETGLSESCVRSKIKELVKKGYVERHEYRDLNERGVYQQYSNRYFFTARAFDFFEDVLESKIRLKAHYNQSDVSKNVLCVVQPPSAPRAGECPPCKRPALITPVSKSSMISQAETNIELTNSSESVEATPKKVEIEQIVADWEKLMNVPVSRKTQAAFADDYLRVNGNPTYYTTRMLEVAADPYLTARAKSINFLFGGLDMALRDKDYIVKRGRFVLSNVETQGQFNEVMSELPAFIASKSNNFAKVSESIINHLLQDDINKARSRLNLSPEPELPKNARELREEIVKQLKTNPPSDLENQLRIILEALPTLNFGHCLQLFQKHCCAKRVPVASPNKLAAEV